MHLSFKVEKQILLNGENLEQLVRDAGFVDVSVRKMKIEVGDWGSGNPQNTISDL